MCFLLLVQNINSQIKEIQNKNRNQDILIQEGRYPRHGLQQLRAHVDVGLPYFQSLVTAKKNGIHLSGTQNCFCLNYIMCISYVYRNNARSVIVVVYYDKNTYFNLCVYIFVCRSFAFEKLTLQDYKTVLRSEITNFMSVMLCYVIAQNRC